jgi:twitching motility protein PilT
MLFFVIPHTFIFFAILQVRFIYFMSAYTEQLKSLLVTTAKQAASDLHISVGTHPTIRVDGILVPLQKEGMVTPEVAEGLVDALLTPEQKKKLVAERQIDFAYALEDKARFRVNVFYQRGFLSAALRLVPARIRTLEELSLPAILHDFTKLSQGFVLIVGPAGHGKSTTLAAFLDEINHARTDHIITIEDPVEYLFSQDRGIISQREVGSDVLSFQDGLRTVLRQDPDVVMVGEMRDAGSISTAMTASETGHLVFSTLHTNIYAFTNKRVLIHRGWLSTNLISVDYHKITDIYVKEGFLQRILFKSGTIAIDTAGTGGKEITLSNVANPYKLKKLLDGLKDK